MIFDEGGGVCECVCNGENVRLTGRLPLIQEINQSIARDYGNAKRL